jgi:type VI protein secretion system component VasF
MSVFLRHIYTHRRELQHAMRHPVHRRYQRMRQLEARRGGAALFLLVVAFMGLCVNTHEL